MKIVRGREGKPSEQRTDTFTGEVWGPLDLVDEGNTVNTLNTVDTVDALASDTSRERLRRQQP